MIVASTYSFPQLLSAMQKAGQCLVAVFIAVLQSTGVKCTAVVHMCVCVDSGGRWSSGSHTFQHVGGIDHFRGSKPPISLLLPHFARPANDRVLQCR